MKKINILIAEDLRIFQQIYQDIFSQDREIEIFKIVDNGRDCIKVLENNFYQIDIVILDIEMPELDGLSVLKIMNKRFSDIPVIISSSYTTRNADITFECMEYGAIDVIEKPTKLQFESNFNLLKETFIQKIKFIYNNYKNQRNSGLNKKRIFKYIGIGASTGGVQAISFIIKNLKKFNHSNIFIFQHIPSGYSYSFAERLKRLSGLEVKEASNNEKIKDGFVYVATGSKNMIIEKDVIKIVDPPKSTISPNIDIGFESLSFFGDKVCGILLTGMGKNGAKGLKKIKENNGLTVVQDKNTSVVYGMARAATSLFVVDEILPLYLIPELINSHIL